MDKIKLLLDENIGALVAEELRGDGYEAASIITDSPGISDKAVLEKARKENRIIVTLDKDFGRLVFQYSQKHTGVILLRLNDESPKNIIRMLKVVLQQYQAELPGKFITVTETRIRLR